MPFGVSIWEVLILLLVLLLIFGAKRLPEMGRSLGKGMREFKDSVTGVEEAVSTTTPTPTHAELPTASPDPDAATGESETRAERETVS
ncbi:MAG TPA: twin-arginine translocase TatA/TatE family subunit [Gaiellaceae bacterium]|nr:twin-arginine translocase TatA/TatE family subunit [Gaiellaceae bacterium]